MREIFSGFLKAADWDATKTAGWPLVLGGAALLGAGAVAGAKLQRGLGRGQVMRADAFKQQARQKQLERQGSFVS